MIHFLVLKNILIIPREYKIMPEIAVVKDDQILSKWPLDDKDIMIGRSPDCHISLNDSLMSWHHAKIIKGYGGYLIEDLKSTNGITINGNRVNKQMLKYGDTISIGNHTLCFNHSVKDKYSKLRERTVIAQASLDIPSHHAEVKPVNIGFVTIAIIFILILTLLIYIYSVYMIYVGA